MSVVLEIFGRCACTMTSVRLRALAISLLIIFSVQNPVLASESPHRLFIQVWWDSPSVEIDPADDPGRIEIYVGSVFVGCAIAPSHMNYRKQLMIVPPSFGLMASGDASAVKVLITGQLGTLPGRQVKISQIEEAGNRPPS